MLSILIFAIVLGVGADALIGLIGSRRNIGFGWAFILSLLFTPLVGLIAVLLSERLPEGAEPKYGILGFSFGCLGTAFVILIITALLLGLAMLFVPVV
ncbi:MAG: hypothetical protein IKY24_07425 [Alistipes sp.]|nr:hypothetical protein [Alistipes sp.]